MAAAVKYAATRGELDYDREVEPKIEAALERYGYPLDQLSDAERLRIFEAHWCAGEVTA